MKKNIVLLLLVIGLISCQTSKKEKDREISKLKIAKKYYKALNNSNSREMFTLISDSIVVREDMDDYEERFSKSGYNKWLEWDSVFNPTYKILTIKQEGDVVKAKISKIDKRIYFLHKEPMVWNDVILFENNKIVRVKRVNYETFDVSKLVENREKLVSWIDKNHPELNGFLFPQTKAIGIKYLKAIELYQKNK